MIEGIFFLLGISLGFIIGYSLARLYQTKGMIKDLDEMDSLHDRSTELINDLEEKLKELEDK